MAIRAQAKHFLVHPSVTQHVKAIQAGKLVFHTSVQCCSGLSGNYSRGRRDQADSRRTVRLYQTKEASIFNLSRLCVPLYRNIVSSLSLIILLGLYLSVLIIRSPTITPIELVFLIWSAGYILDEALGQPKSLIALFTVSFWTVYNLGTLLFLFAFCWFRIYGAVLPEGSKHRIAEVSYDILAILAVFLFPRLSFIL